MFNIIPTFFKTRVKAHFPRIIFLIKYTHQKIKIFKKKFRDNKERVFKH